MVGPPVIDGTDGVTAVAAKELSAAIDNKALTKTTRRGALRTAIEAGEKVCETRRSKEQWIKSRHQVLQEEGVSAIMNKSTSGMMEVSNQHPGEKEPQQGGGGFALANQLRAHQHIAAFLQALQETTGPPTPINLLLANQLAMCAAAPSLAAPAPILKVPLVSVATMAATGKKIQPSAAEKKCHKIALPPVHSMYNMLFTFPEASPLLFNPQLTTGCMPMPPWQQQLPTALPARIVVPAQSSGDFVVCSGITP